MTPFWEHLRSTCGSVVSVVETLNVTVSPQLGRPFPLMSEYTTSVRLGLLLPPPGSLPPPLPSGATREAATYDAEGARIFGDESRSLAGFARSREQLTLLAASTTIDARMTNQRITPPSLPLRDDLEVAFMSAKTHPYRRRRRPRFKFV